MRDLPGHDLVGRGLRDLAAGEETAEAFLVALGAPRLRAAGFPLPERLPAEPKRRLYELLERRSGRAAHSAFNALVRRLVSFERALDRRGSSRP